METITYNPIGLIHSPFKTLDNMPIQPTGAPNVLGEIHISDEFVEGLQDLDGFSHIQIGRAHV